MTENHPEPITEGFTHGSQRLVQIISLAAITRQIHAARRQRLQQAQAAKDAAEESRVATETKAAFDEARSRWAPAHDPRWLHQADLIQAAHAWAAALPYFESSPAAAAAVRKCEQRLRTLHPHAMEHYDRFLSSGMSRENAMRDAAAFFTRDPDVRTGHPAAERRQLGEGAGTEWAAREHGPTRTEWEEHRRKQRGHQIVRDRIQRAPQSRPDEIRTALVNDTNLPEHLITCPGEAPLARGQRTPAEVAADDFPMSISQAMQMTAARAPEQAAPRKPRNPNPDRNRRNSH